MRVSLILVLLILSGCVFAQSDSSAWEETSIFETADPFADSLTDVNGKSDQTLLQKRSFSTSELESLKNDTDLQYKKPPMVVVTLWDRFLNWLYEILSSLLDGAVSTNWGRLIAYILGLAAIIVVVMMILKVDAFKVFASAEGSSVKGNIFEEDIHEIDFDAEIQKATRENDYRRGVRLVFLYALKILSDKQYISWEQGKTNHDYVAEVKDQVVQNGLSELSYYFEYSWYGNFQVTRDVYDKVNFVFTNWKGKVK